MIGHPSRPPGRAVIAFVAALFSLLAIASDLYLPALPSIRRDLGGSDAQAKLTLSALIIGVALGAASLRPALRPLRPPSRTPHRTRAVFGQILMRLHDGTTRPLAAGAALGGCGVLVAYLLLVRERR